VESRQTVFKQLAGTGVLFDSDRSSVRLGPGARTAYVGGLYGGENPLYVLRALWEQFLL
jgi:hypothetical protein